MENELPLESFDLRLLAETVGNWEYVRIISYPDLEVKDPQTGEVLFRVHDRNGALKVWLSNSPPIYVLVYAHAVTPVTAEADPFHIHLRWLNQGGGEEKTEIVRDFVSCRDTARRTVWTYSVAPEKVDHIKKSSAQLLGKPVWKRCHG